eukprot:11485624-Heterocapsa_arctica.AAC.1
MNQADLAVIFKKGLNDLPVNYRPIALLNLSCKILASIIQKRIAQGLDERLDNNQFGFAKREVISNHCSYLRGRRRSMKSQDKSV